MSLLDTCPTPPHWSVDWEDLRARYPFVDRLHDCPQDVVYHAEGDVGIHTAMALDVLATAPAFRALPPDQRRLVYGGVLLHDVAKPLCTRTTPEGRITSRGHSARGEVLARRLLWAEEVAFAEREAICALIRHHQVPFFLVERPDSQRLALAISQSVRCDLLGLVAWADAAGRVCADQQAILDNVSLFSQYCEEQACLDRPFGFASPHARYEYFRRPDRDPHFAAHDDTCFEVVILSGLPGAGKDHWTRAHAAGLPVISLDALRDELGIPAGEPQGRVVDAARERALGYLRARQPFVWNATNLGRALRDPLIERCANYRASVRLVYVERSEGVVRAANRSRPSPVPEHAIQRMLERWEVPRPIEAHRVEYVVADGVSQ